MSKTTNSTHSHNASVEHRLARLLDSPLLARVVPQLAPETLHQIIRHRGLDACGELITSATAAQLTTLLDLDLWREARAGRDPQFDVARFGEWLDVLADTGDAAAARTIAALEQDLVVAGLSRYVRVLDPGIFEPTAQSDDETIERHAAMREGDSIQSDDDFGRDSTGDSLECEIGGYIIRARRADRWDTIVSVLVALEAERRDDFRAVMQECRRLSNSRSEIDGLDELLGAPEQQVHDLSIAREDRQSKLGYATPGDARAFLQMARQPQYTRSEALGAARIVDAYFRSADGTEESPNETQAAIAEPHAADSGDTNAALRSVVEVLTEAGVIQPQPRALLEAADAHPQAASLTHLRRLMAYVRDAHDAAYFERSRELAFLANTLLAGCSIQSRPFTRQEASDAAASICNLGFEYWPARWPGVTAGDSSPSDSLLIDADLVTAFQVGWSVLHQDVSLFVVQQLIAMLETLHSVDGDIQRGLAAFRRTLISARDAGTPRHARGAAEVLAMLDTTVWISVLGLLDECPMLPAALTAIVEGCTTTVSPTAFSFISTAAQIGDVRTFMRKLPGLL